MNNVKLPPQVQHVLYATENYPISGTHYATKGEITANFLTTQKEFFEGDSHLMPKGNHQEHNLDMYYWKVLLSPLINAPDFWRGKSALDFGCGCGRNIVNMLDLVNFQTVDGCDISKSNAIYASAYANHIYRDRKYEGRCKTWETSGWDLGTNAANSYDFIMSHVVFQHIGNWRVRANILSCMFDALKPGGIVSLHFMDLPDSVGYYINSPNGRDNCRVENPEFLIADLERCGFINCVVYQRRDIYSGRPAYFLSGQKNPRTDIDFSITPLDPNDRPHEGGQT